ncbi:MAG: sulfatase-like hydrolase/transferase [Actinomycetota bacterium]
MLTGLVPLASRAHARVATPPNIVVIVTDDMRFDLMDDMPIVQRELVGKGRSFERAFITDPVCCPSRTTFLRGQYAHTTSVFSINGEWGGRKQVLEAGVETQMLNTWLDPNYYTAMVGKYLNGYNSVALPGPAGSWDYGRVLAHAGIRGRHVEVHGRHDPSDGAGVQHASPHAFCDRGDRGIRE